jgi:hypothetical protein
MKRYVKHEMTVVLAVLALGLLVVSAFTLNFWHEPVASQSSRWGEFGDYVGGVLNPAVALAALALLARSIRLQRTELGDTRRVLNEQAKSAATTAKLAALSSLINSINAEISIHRDHLRFLVHQLEQQEATVGQDAASMDGPMADSILGFPQFPGHIQ